MNDWIEWKGKEHVPIDELLLFECLEKGAMGEHSTGIFRKTSNGDVVGFIGGSFHFDEDPIRYKSIQHLIE